MEVRDVKSSVQKPSNVAVFIAVENGDEPVTGLLPSSFEVYENDALVERGQTQLTLLDRDQVALHHAVVLVDLSGEMDEGEREDLAKSAGHFVQKIRKTQAVTVLGFDGQRRLHQLGEFAQSSDAEVPEFPAIRTFRSNDPSRNLYGAVVEGIKELDARLMRQKKPIRIGTLVVFTRGGDMAGRVTEEKLYDALEETDHELYAIGLQNDESGALAALQPQAEVLVQPGARVGIAFDEMAMKVRDAWGKYYLVAYCSPSRAGVRQLRLEVKHTDDEGQNIHGDLRLDFDATGFSGGCDPTTLPRFTESMREPGGFAQEASADSSSGSSPTTTPPPSSTPQKAATSSPAPEAPAGDEGEGDIVAPPDSSTYE